jgi:dehydrogenase/reductase SDR family protein 1
MKIMSNHIVVVTGANRGVGKGIALALGEAGATVYVTGRSTEAGQSKYGGGTIQEVADQVTHLGGRGIATRCDHSDDEQIKAVIDRVQSEQGRLDILVNNVFSFPEKLLQPVPFWEWQDSIPMWDEMHRVGLRSHFVASAFAAPIFIQQKRGLIVNTSAMAAKVHLNGTAYSVLKAAVDRLSACMAHELRPHNVAALSLWPGVVRTERMVAEMNRSPELAALAKYFSVESPEISGRAIIALATDANILAKSGQAFMAADLAREYGFTDTDGTVPVSALETWQKLMA